MTLLSGARPPRGALHWADRRRLLRPRVHQGRADASSPASQPAPRSSPSPFLPGLEARILDLDIRCLDQHLLRNAVVVRKLVDAASLTATDVVLDIGAGTGVVTREVHGRGVRRIYAVEVDEKFRSFLDALAHSHREIEAVYADIRSLDLPPVTKVVANPPFRLTEQLVELLRRVPGLQLASLVMGGAFGRAAAALPGSPHYNQVSLVVQARFTVCLGPVVSAHDFHPPAGGPACLVTLTPRSDGSRTEAALADAFVRRGGLRLKDVLWHLHAHPGHPPDRAHRALVHTLRRSPVVTPLLQRRLRQLTSRELSTLMSEVRRLAS